MCIKELTKDRGFRGFRYFDGMSIEYVFTIRNGSFDCLNNWTFTSGNRIYVKVRGGRIDDVRFDNFSDQFAMGEEAITRNCEKKLKKLIYREMF